MNDTHKPQTLEELRKQKVEAFAVFLENRKAPLETCYYGIDDEFELDEVKPKDWFNDNFCIRLAPTLPLLYVNESDRDAKLDQLRMKARLGK